MRAPKQGPRPKKVGAQNLSFKSFVAESSAMVPTSSISTPSHRLDLDLGS